MENSEKGLIYLSNIQDLMDLSDFMDDPDFTEALELALKCIAKPDLPPANARRALMKMQGYAFMFRMKGQVYMTIKADKSGTDNNKRKNVYFSVSEQCNLMAQTLKYLMRDLG